MAHGMWGKISKLESFSSTNCAINLIRTVQTFGCLLSRMSKSTIGFSDMIEANSHSKIISQKYQYMISNSLFADCYFFLGYINRNNFIKIKDLHRKPEFIHILKTAFDLEGDFIKIESQANKLHNTANFLLSIPHDDIKNF